MLLENYWTEKTTITTCLLFFCQNMCPKKKENIYQFYNSYILIKLFSKDFIFWTPIWRELLQCAHNQKNFPATHVINKNDSKKAACAYHQATMRGAVTTPKLHSELGFKIIPKRDLKSFQMGFKIITNVIQKNPTALPALVKWTYWVYFG